MLNLKGLCHCKPSPTVREWVASFEEAVKRGLIKFEGGAPQITEHSHPELEAMINTVKTHTHADLQQGINNLESTVEGLSARLAGATGTVYNDLRARLTALEEIVEDVRSTVQKIKDL